MGCHRREVQRTLKREFRILGGAERAGPGIRKGHLVAANFLVDRFITKQTQFRQVDLSVLILIVDPVEQRRPVVAGGRDQQGRLEVTLNLARGVAGRFDRHVAIPAVIVGRGEDHRYARDRHGNDRGDKHRHQQLGQRKTAPISGHCKALQAFRRRWEVSRPAGREATGSTPSAPASPAIRRCISFRR